MPRPEWVKENPVYSRIWSRLHNKNQNWNCAIVGPNGSGKSYAALSIADALDISPKGDLRFSIDKVAFDTRGFLDLVRQTHPKGTFLIFDEAALSVNARTFLTQSNMIMSFVNQSFRFKNYGTIYTFPANLGFLDLQLRSLLHASIRMQKINYSQKVAIGTMYNIKFSDTKAEPYRPRPRFYDKEGNMKIMKAIGIPHPRKELTVEYEERKQEFIENSFSKYANQFDSMDGFSEVSDRGGRRRLAIMEIIKKPEEFKKEIRDKNGIRDVWNYGGIAKRFGVSIRTAKDWVEEAGGGYKDSIL